MSRNRKNQTVALRFGPALKVLSLCVFLAGAGVGYVWQKDQINTLGDRIKQREAKYERLRRQNDMLSRALSALQSPAEIEARIKQLDLGLVPSTPDQIVHLVDAPVSMENALSNSVRLYAEQAQAAGIHR